MALTFQTFFLTHAGQPVSDGLAMFQHARQHKSEPSFGCWKFPSPIRSSALHGERQKVGGQAA